MRLRVGYHSTGAASRLRRLVDWVMSCEQVSLWQRCNDNVTNQNERRKGEVDVAVFIQGVQLRDLTVRPSSEVLKASQLKIDVVAM